MRFDSPTSCRNADTLSSNRAWPFSMHDARRMVRMRTRLPAPFCTTSNGGFALAISDSAGLSWTGTFRCISTLAVFDARRTADGADAHPLAGAFLHDIQRWFRLGNQRLRRLVMDGHFQVHFHLGRFRCTTHGGWCGCAPACRRLFARHPTVVSPWQSATPPACHGRALSGAFPPWPFSMHDARRMVRMRTRLPAPFCTTSNGGFALAISDSVGLSWTGTFRCISTLAAADVLMALGAADGATGSEPVVTLPAPAGMVMVSPQEGHSICEPAPVWSTASSCSQFGQLKTMSIIWGS